jgi:hypothetical protein
LSGRRVGNKSSLVTCSANSTRALLVLISWLSNLAFIRLDRLSRVVKTYSPVAVISLRRYKVCGANSSEIESLYYDFQGIRALEIGELLSYHLK